MKKWQEIKERPWFQVLSNKYLLATVLFAVWMLWFDANSWEIHHQLNSEIERLEASKEYYEKGLERDQRQLRELSSDPEKLEKFAREQYYLQRPGEEVYIIPPADSTAED